MPLSLSAERRGKRAGRRERVGRCEPDPAEPVDGGPLAVSPRRRGKQAGEAAEDGVGHLATAPFGQPRTSLRKSAADLGRGVVTRRRGGAVVLAYRVRAAPRGKTGEAGLGLARNHAVARRIDLRKLDRAPNTADTDPIPVLAARAVSVSRSTFRQPGIACSRTSGSSRACRTVARNVDTVLVDKVHRFVTDDPGSPAAQQMDEKNKRQERDHDQ